MDILIRFGFSITEIKNMMDTNPDIEITSDKNIQEIIAILNSIGCTNNHISNIFLSNPYCLSIKPKDITKTVQKINSLGVKHIEVLLDTNPYILNINSKDIQKVVKEKAKENLSIEEIIDYFYYHSEELI